MRTKYAVKKDIKEYFRTKKFFIYFLTLILTGAAVLLTTSLFPQMVAVVMSVAPGEIAESPEWQDLLGFLCPQDVKGNMEMFMADVGLIYSIVIAFTIQGIIPGEIKNGKWIMPVASGYKKSSLLLSKCFVYGLGTGIPVIVTSILYYFGACALFENNVTFMMVVMNGLALGIAECGLSILIISTASISRSSIVAAIGILVIVLSVPDLTSRFSWCRYLPTYLYIFAYSMKLEYGDLLIPVAGLLALCLLVPLWAAVRIRTKRAK